MSEHKKVSFTTVPTDKNEEKEKKFNKTIRFNLNISESNEKSCSEFNYGDLLNEHFHKKFVNKPKNVANGPILQPNDPINPEDDEGLKDLAKQFEKKYGANLSGKKKKRVKDFKSLGQGYDETDPFIDNSDAVDDVVPKNKDTKFGGFYINCGELDFQELEASRDSLIFNKIKRKRKQVISSDDEEEDHSRKTQINGVTKGKDLEAGELLRKKKSLIHKLNSKKLKPNSPDNSEKEVSIAASIEAVINKVREASKTTPEDNDTDALPEEPKKDAPSTNSSSSSSSDSSSSESETENEEVKANITQPSTPKSNTNSAFPEENNKYSSQDSEEEVPLPDNLPPELVEVIDKIKEVGRNSKGSSQKFFMDTAVNKMLLSIEIKLSKLGGRMKTQVYRHLANHLPCGPQTLIKRGRNLLTERLDSRLKDPMKTLKEEIENVMPNVLEKYAQECKIVMEKKESQLEGGNGIDKSENNTLPKKKFVFNESIKSKLCEVVKIRCQGWNMIRKRNEIPEDHVKAFLEETLKPLWPKGWITNKALYKESAKAHSYLTYRNPKEKSASNGVSDIKPLSVSNLTTPDYSEVKSENVDKSTNDQKVNVTDQQYVPEPPMKPCTKENYEPKVENLEVKPEVKKISPRKDYAEGLSGIIQKAIENSFENAKLEECRPPKPSLSATAIPKLVLNPKPPKAEKYFENICVPVKPSDRPGEYGADDRLKMERKLMDEARRVSKAHAEREYHGRNMATIEGDRKHINPCEVGKVKVEYNADGRKKVEYIGNTGRKIEYIDDAGRRVEYFDNSGRKLDYVDNVDRRLDYADKRKEEYYDGRKFEQEIEAKRRLEYMESKGRVDYIDGKGRKIVNYLEDGRRILEYGDGKRRVVNASNGSHSSVYADDERKRYLEDHRKKEYNAHNRKMIEEEKKRMIEQADPYNRNNIYPDERKRIIEFGEDKRLAEYANDIRRSSGYPEDNRSMAGVLNNKAEVDIPRENIMDLSVDKSRSTGPTDLRLSGKQQQEAVDLCIKDSPCKTPLTPSKLDEEMDQVMNELLEISKQKQNTPEPITLHGNSDGYTPSPKSVSYTPPPPKNIISYTPPPVKSHVSYTPPPPPKSHISPEIPRSFSSDINRPRISPEVSKSHISPDIPKSHISDVPRQHIPQDSRIHMMPEVSRPHIAQENPRSHISPEAPRSRISPDGSLLHISVDSHRQQKHDLHRPQISPGIKAANDKIGYHYESSRHMISPTKQLKHSSNYEQYQYQSSKVPSTDSAHYKLSRSNSDVPHQKPFDSSKYSFQNLPKASPPNNKNSIQKIPDPKHHSPTKYNIPPQTSIHSIPAPKEAIKKPIPIPLPHQMSIQGRISGDNMVPGPTARTLTVHQLSDSGKSNSEPLSLSLQRQGGAPQNSNISHYTSNKPPSHQKIPSSSPHQKSSYSVSSSSSSHKQYSSSNSSSHHKITHPSSSHSPHHKLSHSSSSSNLFDPNHSIHS